MTARPRKPLPCLMPKCRRKTDHWTGYCQPCWEAAKRGKRAAK